MTFDDSGFDHHSAPPGSYVYNEEGKAITRITVKARIDARTTAGCKYSIENGAVTRTSKGSISLSKDNARRTFRDAIDPELLRVYGVWMGRDKTLPVEAWIVQAGQELGIQGVESILAEIAKDPALEEEAKIKAINTLYDKELTRRNISGDPEVIRLREEHAAWVAHLKAEQKAKEDAEFWQRVDADYQPAKAPYSFLREQSSNPAHLDPLNARTFAIHFSTIGGPECLRDWEDRKDQIRGNWQRDNRRSTQTPSIGYQTVFELLFNQPTDDQLVKLQRDLRATRKENRDRCQEHADVVKGIKAQHPNYKGVFIRALTPRLVLKDEDTIVSMWGCIYGYRSVPPILILGLLGEYRARKYGIEPPRKL